MTMPKGLLMSLPKRPLEQMIQPYPGTTQPMIGSSGTKGSRTFSSWIPSLQPRKVANHHEAIHVVNVLFSTLSSMMWNFLMAKSKSMQLTSLLKTC